MFSSRREFLAGAGGAALTLTLPSRAWGLPLETLLSPLVLSTGESLTNHRYKLADNFAWTNGMAAIYVADGATGVTIRDVELIGSDHWLPRWYQNVEPGPQGVPLGINSGMAGIRAQGAPGLLVERVQISGFPRAAIAGFGWDNAVFRDVTVRNCFQGINCSYLGSNNNVLVERLNVRNCWGPGAGRWLAVGGAPSRVHRRGFVGSDGFALHALRNSTIRDCTVFGEYFGGGKLVNPQDCVIERFHGVNLQISGTTHATVGSPDLEPGRDTIVRDCILDRRYGTRGAGIAPPPALLVSQNMDTLTVEDCQFFGREKDGHAIQFAVNCNGTINGCHIEGHNGASGVGFAYALQTVTNSSVNADFETANEFVNQTRFWNQLT